MIAAVYFRCPPAGESLRKSPTPRSVCSRTPSAILSLRRTACDWPAWWVAAWQRCRLLGGNSAVNRYRPTFQGRIAEASERARSSSIWRTSQRRTERPQETDRDIGATAFATENLASAVQTCSREPMAKQLRATLSSACGEHGCRRVVDSKPALARSRRDQYLERWDMRPAPKGDWLHGLRRLHLLLDMITEVKIAPSLTRRREWGD